MANKSLGSLTLDLIANIGGYVGPLSKADRATAASAEKIKKNVAKLSTAAAGLAVGIETAFVAMVKSSINFQDEISKASQKIGVSVEDLSKLAYAADLSDVAFDNLVGSLGKLNKGLAEAFNTGKGSAAEALADLGISASDTEGRLRDTNDVFLEIAEKLSTLQDGATKTSLAMELFGKSGAELIPLLNGGRQGLAEMATEAEKLGQVLSTDAAKQAEEFNDNLTRLQKTFTGVANKVAADLLPSLVEFSDKIKDPAFQEGISSLAQGLLSITTSIAGAASGFGNFAKFLGDEVASRINGISGEDIPRLEARLADLQKSLNGQTITESLFSSVSITASVEAREKERDAILKSLDAYNQYQASIAKAKNNTQTKISDIGDDPFALTGEQIEGARKLREAREAAAKAATKQAEEAVKHAKELEKTFTDELSNLQREIDLYGEVSRVSSLAYEMEKGNLKELSDKQKEQLAIRAQLLDMRERDQKLMESQREVDLASMGDKGQLESAQFEYDLKNGIIKLNETLNAQDREKLINNKKLVEQYNEQAQIAELIKQQQRSIDLNGKTSKAAQTEYDIRNDILKVYGGINSEQGQILINQAKALDAQEKFKSVTELTQDAAERVNDAFANAWLNIEDGFTGLRDGIVGGFKQMLAEMAHEAITKPIILQLQQSLTGAAGQAGGGSSSGGGSAGGAGALAAGGIYAAIALAVVAGVQVWNKQQEEKFAKMAAQYKQANQGLSKVLGEGNRKSQAIANGITNLQKSDGDLLDVNHKMLTSLEGIRAGITDVAAGFAKTLVGSADYKALGINERVGFNDVGNVFTGQDDLKIKQAIGGTLGDALQLADNFTNAIMNKVSKAFYSKKVSVTDSGVALVGSSLADILSGTVLQAYNYADVKTKKKVLGVTTSTKVKRTTEDLDAVFEEQLTDVFKNAADALRGASDILGIEFDNFVNDLKINSQDISLKGLEGDALTKELESFFSKTLDDWAGALLGAGNTRILEDFQQVGESAFDTMLRLAGETRTFAKYADALNLNFNVAGKNAVYATQAIAEFAGGFDALASSLSVYYDKFFNETDKFEQQQTALTKAFSELGESLPASRAGFKNLIQGLNLANEADQKRFAQLVQLSDATDKYFDSLKNSATGAFSALTTAVEKQKAAVQTQIDAANNALNSTKAVAASLNSALKSMALQSAKNELVNRRQAQAEVIAATAIARAGGPLPKEGQLDDALSVLTQPSQDLYASFEDYARDFYTTSKNIKDLADLTGEQQTAEEQSLEVLNSQLSALDDLLTFYQTQIDKLDSIDGSVLSVRSAIDNLNNTLAEAGVNITAPVAPTASYDYEALQTSKSQTYAANTPVLSSFNTADLLARVDTLTQQLSDSQFAIAKNTLNTAKILQRWDADGMPAEATS